MEPLHFFPMSIIIVGIIAMAAQNLSMLSGKWRKYYVGILLFKLLVTYINSAHPYALPMSGTDAEVFTSDALTILRDSENNFFKIFSCQANLFSKETAVVFLVCGAHRAYMCFLICFCSLIAFRYLILMAKEMTGNYELAQKCGILYLIWPVLLMHASTFIRENQCQLLFILSFYNFVRFVKRRSLINFGFAIIWSVIAAMTHSGMIALVVSYCVFGSMVSRSGRIKFSPVRIVLGFVLIFVLMSSSFAENMTEKFHGAEEAQSVEEFTDIVSREKVKDADSLYISSIPSNPIKLLLLEPYLFVMFVFAPFPHQIHSIGQGVSFILESIPQFCIVSATFIYLVVRRNRGTPQVRGYKTVGLWTMLLFYFIFSLGTTTYGTAIRHRAKISPLVLTFAVMYFAERKGIAVGTEEVRSWRSGGPFVQR